ncbi:MAG: four helix bundle protein [Candidatus Cloacimonetes bacterium]|nr:four helix bundle protein [Candidatus Cloacimonadota bacterium]
MAFKHFEDVSAWKLARKLNQELTKTLDLSANPLTASFLRTCTLDIMNCIAEAFEKEDSQYFTKQLYSARGACGKLRSLLYVAFDEEIFTQEQLDDLTVKCYTISDSILQLIRSLQRIK